MLPRKVRADGVLPGEGSWRVSHVCLSPQLHCTVPAYNFPVTALAIAPDTNNLVIAHSDQQVSTAGRR